MGLGWKAFSFTGFERAVGVGTPIIKNLRQEYVNSPEKTRSSSGLATVLPEMLYNTLYSINYISTR